MSQSIQLQCFPSSPVPTVPAGVRLPAELPLTSQRDSYGDKLRRRLAIVAAVAVVLAAAGCKAHAQPVAESPGVVDRNRVGVVDGDSITLDDREWRIRGFDAAEIDRAAWEGERRLGLLAKRRLEALIAAAREIRVEGGQEADRYKRPLGDVLVDGRQVREIMIAEDLGRPYNGGRKKGWCSRDSRDDLIPGPAPARDQRKGG